MRSSGFEPEASVDSIDHWDFQTGEDVRMIRLMNTKRCTTVCMYIYIHVHMFFLFSFLFFFWTA